MYYLQLTPIEVSLLISAISVAKFQKVASIGSYSYDDEFNDEEQRRLTAIENRLLSFNSKQGVNNNDNRRSN